MTCCVGVCRFKGQHCPKSSTLFLLQVVSLVVRSVPAQNALCKGHKSQHLPTVQFADAKSRYEQL